jgi:hypothetical protein
MAAVVFQRVMASGHLNFFATFETALAVIGLILVAAAMAGACEADLGIGPDRHLFLGPGVAVLPIPQLRAVGLHQKV